MGESDSGMIVDNDVEILPADARNVIATLAGDAVAWFDDAPELLDIKVEQIAGSGVLVAIDRRRRAESGESEPIASQYD